SQRAHQPRANQKSFNYFHIMLVSYLTNRFRKSRQAMLQSVFFEVTIPLKLHNPLNSTVQL
ncbi:MAG: hypothetical protein LRY34_03365, partial [Bacteroides graminisolvens]|nr:hypothetical protein [Bacteroides graminisolvens]